MNVFDLRGPEFLKFYFFLVVFCFIAALILRWWLPPQEATCPTL